jgi:hypothetical protein
MFKIKDGFRIGTVDVFNNSGTLLVNAPTASKLTNQTSITLSGAVTGTINYDGSTNVTISTTLANDIVQLGINTTGNYVQSVSAGTGIVVTGTLGEGWTPTVSLSHLGIQNLVDPNADRILFWDDSANSAEWLTIGAGLTLNGTTLTANIQTDTTYDISSVSATGGANLRLTGTNSTTDDVKFVGAGIASVTSTDANTITITATEVDTLQSVADRGATTSTPITITNATTSTSTTTGALIVTGGIGVGNNVNVNGNVAVNGGEITTSSTTTNIFNTTATTVNIGGAATTIGIGASTGNTTVNNNLVVSGNLIVQGTSTTISTATLQVEDQNIELGKVDTPTNATANGGGITILAGTDVDKTWSWLSATSAWTSSEHIDISTNKEYHINNTSVLSATTLGSGVVNSSLTSVGTLTSGTWDASTIAVNRGGTGQTSYTNGQILIGNSTGNTLTKSTLTAGTNVNIENGNGSITISSSDTTYSISTENGANTYEKIIRLTAGGSGSGTDDVILAVGATGSTYGLTIAETGDTITFAHANTSSLTGQQGSTGIAHITVDEMGHVTSVSTANYLTAETDTLQSTTDRGASTTNAVSITNTTDSTSSSTGALIVSGGVAVNKNIFVSGNVIDATASGVAIAYNNAIQTTVTSVNPTTIDTFPLATFRSGKYLIQISQGTNYQISEFRVIHNGTTTFITEYSVLETNGPLGDISAAVVGTNVVISVEMNTSASATFNIQRTLIVV